jgi:hypothetical protein
MHKEVIEYQTRTTYLVSNERLNWKSGVEGKGYESRSS